jgi:hypothetical protein
VILTGVLVQVQDTPAEHAHTDSNSKEYKVRGARYCKHVRAAVCVSIDADALLVLFANVWGCVAVAGVGLRQA